MTVALCRKHKHAFTVYPPGYAPYTRQSVAPAAPNGSLLHRAEPATGLPADTPWGATLFGAALDAAGGKAWRPEGAAFTTGKWRTQQRHIEHCLNLFALTVVHQRQRHEVAELIGVAHVELQHTAQQVTKTSGYRQRGAAVKKILNQLQLRASLPTDLLRCGAVVGMWAEPMFS